jgi:ribosome assembly protein RRB1
MKWADMKKTLKEEDESESQSDEEDNNPELRFETIPHKGCVNRIRSLHGSGIVATWNDDNEVGIYNISSAIEALDNNDPKTKNQKKSYGGTKLAAFKYSDEGFALDWSPLTWGRLAAGSCNS